MTTQKRKRFISSGTEGVRDILAFSNFVYQDYGYHILLCIIKF